MSQGFLSFGKVVVSCLYRGRFDSRWEPWLGKARSGKTFLLQPTSVLRRKLGCSSKGFALEPCCAAEPSPATSSHLLGPEPVCGLLSPQKHEEVSGMCADRLSPQLPLLRCGANTDIHLVAHCETIRVGPRGLCTEPRSAC